MSLKIAVLAANEYIYQKWLRSMFPCHWNKFKYIGCLEDMGSELFLDFIEIHEDQCVNPAYDENFIEALQEHVIDLKIPDALSFVTTKG